MSEPSFNESWLDFLSRTDQNKLTVEFLQKNLDALELRNAERILSVGPGEGEVDAGLMSVLPTVKHYTALEPNGPLREALKQRVLRLNREIQLDLQSDTMETYSGPSEPVDIVLMVHVCYYMRKTFSAQIKRALQWLRPGGHLILVHKEPGAFRTELEEIMNSNKEEQTISVSWSTADSLKAMNIPCKEESIQITLDWTLPGLVSIVRIYSNHHPNQQQLEQCIEIAKRHSKPGVTKIHEDMLLHVIPQKALSCLS